MLKPEVINRLKIKTGSYQFKLLDKNKFPIGSGFLLNYKGKYFFITCNHCLKYVDDVNELIVPIIYPTGKVKSFNLRKLRVDEDLDLAAFEISYLDLSQTENTKKYIFNDLIENLDNNPILENDFVILHATPFSGVERDDQEGFTQMIFDTFPYFTVVTDYSDNFITVSVNEDGIGEDGNLYDIPYLSGMSGSPAFRLNIDNEIIKWIGILSNGTPESGNAFILDNKTILQFLDNMYFDKTLGLSNKSLK